MDKYRSSIYVVIILLIVYLIFYILEKRLKDNTKQHIESIYSEGFRATDSIEKLKDQFNLSDKKAKQLQVALYNYQKTRERIDNI